MAGDDRRRDDMGRREEQIREERFRYNEQRYDRIDQRRRMELDNALASGADKLGALTEGRSPDPSSTGATDRDRQVDVNETLDRVRAWQRHAVRRLAAIAHLDEGLRAQWSAELSDIGLGDDAFWEMDGLVDRIWSEVDAYPYVWEELDLRAMHLKGDLVELSKVVREIQLAVQDYHRLLD